MNLDDLEFNITEWAHARNLIDGTDSSKQFVKLIEEAGEVAECIAKERHESLKAEIGDMLVVLNNIAVQNKTTLNECLLLAWLKIKDRKGMMVDGYYIKEEDLPAPEVM